MSEPDRRDLQAAGTHPAPCARHCEAKAFEIEIRSLNLRLKQQAEPAEQSIWVLTSEYNDYDQHGEYFEDLFLGKPTLEQIQKCCQVNEEYASHILSGGGRVNYEDKWYNLRQEAAHNIKEL